MIIEQATRADFKEVLTVLAECGLPSGNLEVSDMDSFLVARSGRCIVGIVGVIIQGSMAIGHSLAVVPGFRGLGLGRKLAAGILDFSAAAGAGSVFLFTCQAEFYFRAMGFSVVQHAEVPESVMSVLSELCDTEVVRMGHVLTYHLEPLHMAAGAESLSTARYESSVFP